jgi:hypothetical protein
MERLYGIGAGAHRGDAGPFTSGGAIAMLLWALRSLPVDRATMSTQAGCDKAMNGIAARCTYISSGR